jgi:Tfp pilus assembly protein PilF
VGLLWAAAAVAAAQLTTAELLFRQGVDLFEKGRAGEAAPLLEGAVAAEPGRALYWKALGVVYAAQADYALAQPAFQKACQLDEKLADACYYLGRNYYLQNQFQPALEAFEKALKAPGILWKAHLGTAQALEALERPIEAEQQFRKALSLERGESRQHEDPRVHLGLFLLRQGRAQEALAPLGSAVQRAPDSPKARFELGRALYQTGQLERAAEHLRAAVEVDSTNAPAHLLLGKVYARLGREAEGEKHTRLGESIAAREANR